MKKMTSMAFLATGFMMLTSCASIVSGNQQSISVNTGHVQGATCALENNKGKWYVNRTPASVTVQRSYTDLVVTCEKKGISHGEKRIASHTKGMAFGNILFGGVIGVGVDMANGAAYDYPVDINVPMGRERIS